MASGCEISSHQSPMIEYGSDREKVIILNKGKTVAASVLLANDLNHGVPLYLHIHSPIVYSTQQVSD